MAKTNKPLDYKYATSVINYDKSKTFKKLSEKNDCSVRAIATAVDVEYDEAHEYIRDVFKREVRKGCTNMVKTCIQLKGEEQEIAGKSFEFKYVPRQMIRNQYKLYGDYIYRNKTVKSFIKDFTRGTYLVFVANHVFTVMDGMLIDNNGEEYRPTRKVIDAVKVEVKEDKSQLDFLGELEPVKRAARG